MNYAHEIVTLEHTRLRPGAMSTTNERSWQRILPRKHWNIQVLREIHPHRSTHEVKCEFPIAKYFQDNLPTCSNFDSYPTPESAIDQSRRRNPAL